MDNLLAYLRVVTPPDDVWQALFDQVASRAIAVHLAIFTEPYLGLIFAGRKTIESRFSISRIAPYQQLATGDLVLLKRSSGPLLGVGIVGEVQFYALDAETLRTIRAQFGAALCCTDAAFWQQRERAKYATLLHFAALRAVAARPFARRDRRGWVVLQRREVPQPSVSSPSVQTLPDL